MKERLPHGSFLPWIEAEFGMSDKTAQKMMQVARVYGGKSELSSHLDPTALYELAAPKTPIEVREEVERMIAGKMYEGKSLNFGDLEHCRSRSRAR